MSILLNVISVCLLLVSLACCVMTFKNKLKFFFGVISSSGFILASVITNIFKYNHIYKADVITAVINEQFDTISQVIMQLPSEQLMQKFGGVLGDDPAVFYQKISLLLSEIKQMYFLAFPSILILNILVMVFIVYLLIKQVLGIMGRDVSKHPTFSQLTLKRSAAVVLILSYIMANTLSGAMIVAALINISAILGGVAFACGFSFLDFKLRKKVKNAWLRFALYIAIFFSVLTIIGIVVFGLILIGIFDSFADYRKLQKKEA